MAKNFNAYTADAEELIEEARESIISADDAQMKACHRALADFIASSDDTIAGIIELDDVVSNAMRDLTLARLDQSLVKNLSARSADIARLAKTFGNQSLANSSAAATLRLERVKAVLDAGTTAVNELKKLADSVDTSTPDGKKLDKSLADAVAALISIQKQLAT